ARTGVTRTAVRDRGGGEEGGERVRGADPRGGAARRGLEPRRGGAQAGDAGAHARMPDEGPRDQEARAVATAGREVGYRRHRSWGESRGSRVPTTRKRPRR